MKKIWLGFVLAFGIVSAVMATAYQLGIGRGGYFTATTTAQQIMMVTTNGSDGAEAYAVCVSVQNLGTNTVFLSYNCANAGFFNRAVVNNESIPLDESEYFDIQGNRIQSIWVKTTNATARIKVGAY